VTQFPLIQRLVQRSTPQFFCRVLAITAGLTLLTLPTPLPDAAWATSPALENPALLPASPWAISATPIAEKKKPAPKPAPRPAPKPAPKPAPAPAPKGIDLLRAMEGTFVEIIAQVEGAVVSITPVDPPMGMMFSPHSPGGPDGAPNLPPGHGMPGEGNSPDDEPGNGSGFILDQAGNVITNAHVIGKADTMQVRLPDGRHYTARLVGRDPETDIAVLRLARPEGDAMLPVLPLGNSDHVRPGQWSLAVGNPFGLDSSATVGIVSAVGREGVNLAHYENFIQTDAPINPGNSGGPLLNINGEVIGINTAIISFAQGIGFAIPSNMVRDVVGQLLATGQVERGWLGIGIQEITDDLAETFNVKSSAGVLVNEVFADQPAARSGLKPGDVIVSLNGTAVTSPNTLSRLIAGLRPNSTAKLGYLRDGKQGTLDVALARRESAMPVSAPTAPPRRQNMTLGMDLQTVTPELAQQLDINGGGVVVTSVDTRGSAYAQGIREGDVIREVNRMEVTDVAMLEAILKKRAPDSRILLRITNDKGGRYVVLQAPPAGPTPKQ